MKATWSLILVAAAAVSQATLIDDFTTGGYTNSISSGYALAFQNGSMMGGERGVYMEVVDNPLTVPELQVYIGNGMQITTTGTLLQARVQLGYGYTSNGSGGWDTADLHQDFTGDDAFRVHFLANDLALTMTLFAGSVGGNWGNSVVAVDPDQSPFTVTVPFASFSDSVDWTDVNQIVFQFDTSPSGDFAISKVETVPEPASIAALGLGALTLLRRRRTR